MDLAPCTACRRHVATGAACPFCASDALPAARPVTKVGRVSRAMVFGAALGATAACGARKPASNDPATTNTSTSTGTSTSTSTTPPDETNRGKLDGDATYEDPLDNERRGGGCVQSNPAEAERLEKLRADAKTDEEKAALDEQIREARMPVCMPYGAPPRRRRIV